MSANIDQITPTENLTDLSRYTSSEFTIPDHQINQLFDDLILAEYVDVSPDGNAIKRDGIFIPLNTSPRAWRVAQVVMAGDGCNNINVGDRVVFPGDMGIPVSKLQYTQLDGTSEQVVNGVFLNEERVFGVAAQTSDEGSSTHTQGSA